MIVTTLALLHGATYISRGLVRVIMTRMYEGNSLDSEATSNQERQLKTIQGQMDGSTVDQCNEHLGEDQEKSRVKTAFEEGLDDGETSTTIEDPFKIPTSHRSIAENEQAESPPVDEEDSLGKQDAIVPDLTSTKEEMQEHIGSYKPEEHSSFRFDNDKTSKEVPEAEDIKTSATTKSEQIPAKRSFQDEPKVSTEDEKSIGSGLTLDAMTTTTVQSSAIIDIDPAENVVAPGNVQQQTESAKDIFDATNANATDVTTISVESDEHTQPDQSERNPSDQVDNDMAFREKLQTENVHAPMNTNKDQTTVEEELDVQMIQLHQDEATKTGNLVDMILDEIIRKSAVIKYDVSSTFECTEECEQKKSSKDVTSVTSELDKHTTSCTSDLDPSVQLGNDKKTAVEVVADDAQDSSNMTNSDQTPSNKESEQQAKLQLQPEKQTCKVSDDLKVSDEERKPPSISKSIVICDHLATSVETVDEVSQDDKVSLVQLQEDICGTNSGTVSDATSESEEHIGSDTSKQDPIVRTDNDNASKEELKTGNLETSTITTFDINQTPTYKESAEELNLQSHNGETTSDTAVDGGLTSDDENEPECTQISTADHNQQTKVQVQPEEQTYKVSDEVVGSDDERKPPSIQTSNANCDHLGTSVETVEVCQEDEEFLMQFQGDVCGTNGSTVSDTTPESEEHMGSDKSKQDPIVPFDNGNASKEESETGNGEIEISTTTTTSEINQTSPYKEAAEETNLQSLSQETSSDTASNGNLTSNDDSEPKSIQVSTADYRDGDPTIKFSGELKAQSEEKLSFEEDICNANVVDAYDGFKEQMKLPLLDESAAGAADGMASEKCNEPEDVKTPATNDTDRFPSFIFIDIVGKELQLKLEQDTNGTGNANSLDQTLLCTEVSEHERCYRSQKNSSIRSNASCDHLAASVEALGEVSQENEESLVQLQEDSCKTSGSTVADATPTSDEHMGSDKFKQDAVVRFDNDNASTEESETGNDVETSTATISYISQTPSYEESAEETNLQSHNGETTFDRAVDGGLTSNDDTEPECIQISTTDHNDIDVITNVSEELKAQPGAEPIFEKDICSADVVDAYDGLKEQMQLPLPDVSATGAPDGISLEKCNEAKYVETPSTNDADRSPSFIFIDNVGKGLQLKLEQDTNGTDNINLLDVTPLCTEFYYHEISDRSKQDPCIRHNDKVSAIEVVTEDIQALSNITNSYQTPANRNFGQHTGLHFQTEDQTCTVSDDFKSSYDETELPNVQNPTSSGENLATSVETVDKVSHEDKKSLMQLQKEVCGIDGINLSDVKLEEEEHIGSDTSKQDPIVPSDESNASKDELQTGNIETSTTTTFDIYQTPTYKDSAEEMDLQSHNGETTSDTAVDSGLTSGDENEPECIQISTADHNQQTKLQVQPEEQTYKVPDEVVGSDDERKPPSIQTLNANCYHLGTSVETGEVCQEDEELLMQFQGDVCGTNGSTVSDATPESEEHIGSDKSKQDPIVPFDNGNASKEESETRNGEIEISTTTATSEINQTSPYKEAAEETNVLSHKEEITCDTAVDGGLMSKDETKLECIQISTADHNDVDPTINSSEELKVQPETELMFKEDVCTSDVVDTYDGLKEQMKLLLSDESATGAADGTALEKCNEPEDIKTPATNDTDLSPSFIFIGYVEKELQLKQKDTNGTNDTNSSDQIPLCTQFDKQENSARSKQDPCIRPNNDNVSAVEIVTDDIQASSNKTNNNQTPVNKDFEEHRGLHLQSKEQTFQVSDDFKGLHDVTEPPNVQKSTVSCEHLATSVETVDAVSHEDKEFLVELQEDSCKTNCIIVSDAAPESEKHMGSDKSKQDPIARTDDGNAIREDSVTENVETTTTSDIDQISSYEESADQTDLRSHHRNSVTDNASGNGLTSEEPEYVQSAAVEPVPVDPVNEAPVEFKAQTEPQMTIEELVHSAYSDNATDVTLPLKEFESTGHSVSVKSTHDSSARFDNGMECKEKLQIENVQTATDTTNSDQIPIKEEFEVQTELPLHIDVPLTISQDCMTSEEETAQHDVEPTTTNATDLNSAFKSTEIIEKQLQSNLDQHSNGAGDVNVTDGQSEQNSSVLMKYGKKELETEKVLISTNTTNTDQPPSSKEDEDRVVLKLHDDATIAGEDNDQPRDVQISATTTNDDQATRINKEFANQTELRSQPEKIISGESDDVTRADVKTELETVQRSTLRGNNLALENPQLDLSTDATNPMVATAGRKHLLQVHGQDNTPISSACVFKGTTTMPSTKSRGEDLTEAPANSRSFTTYDPSEYDGFPPGCSKAFKRRARTKRAKARRKAEEAKQNIVTPDPIKSEPKVGQKVTTLSTETINTATKLAIPRPTLQITSVGRETSSDKCTTSMTGAFTIKTKDTLTQNSSRDEGKLETTPISTMPSRTEKSDSKVSEISATHTEQTNVPSLVPATIRERHPTSVISQGDVKEERRKADTEDVTRQRQEGYKNYNISEQDSAEITSRAVESSDARILQTLDDPGDQKYVDNKVASKADFAQSPVMNKTGLTVAQTNEKMNDSGANLLPREVRPETDCCYHENHQPTSEQIKDTRGLISSESRIGDVTSTYQRRYCINTIALPPHVRTVLGPSNSVTQRYLRHGSLVPPSPVRSTQGTSNSTTQPHGQHESLALQFPVRPVHTPSNNTARQDGRHHGSLASQFPVREFRYSPTNNTSQQHSWYESLAPPSRVIPFRGPANRILRYIRHESLAAPSTARSAWGPSKNRTQQQKLHEGLFPTSQHVRPTNNATQIQRPNDNVAPQSFPVRRVWGPSSNTTQRHRPHHDKEQGHENCPSITDVPVNSKDQSMAREKVRPALPDHAAGLTDVYEEEGFPPGYTAADKKRARRKRARARKRAAAELLAARDEEVKLTNCIKNPNGRAAGNNEENKESILTHEIKEKKCEK